MMPSHTLDALNASSDIEREGDSNCYVVNPCSYTTKQHHYYLLLA